MNERCLTTMSPRRAVHAAMMARAVQANALQLQIALHRHAGGPAPRLPSPGGITRFRDAVIDWRDVRDYPPDILALRAHESWGQHALFVWAFYGTDPHAPPAHEPRRPPPPMRCPAALGAKLFEVERGLWRLRHEDQLRHQPEPRTDDDWRREHEKALDTPMLVFGQNVRTCGDEDLLACTCQYAGMLAAARWLVDDRWTWAQAGIMELDGTPIAPPA